MKKILISVAAIFLAACSLHAQRNLFSSVWNESSLDSVLVNHWEPWPVYSDRQAWESLPDTVRNQVISNAEKLIGKPYEFLPVSEYLGFVRDGNRNRFEKIYFTRRVQLLQLLVAECMEGKGRFTDDIINGIWAICEESSWCLPAHVGSKDGLPDTDKPVVDLFAAETAAQLAFTDYLYGSELDRISPMIRQRLREEIRKRIFLPFLERDDFWWMGISGNKVNNWNPWIISNILTSSMLVVDDRPVQLRLVARSLMCLDNFTNNYPSDGGCDEGPGYWLRAGASLFNCLETLYSASSGKINYYNDPLIKNIGQYIYKVFISYPWFINFADASPRSNSEPCIIYDYGRAIGDDMMVAFGARLDSGKVSVLSMSDRSISRVLPHLFNWAKIQATPGAWPYVRDAWLPDIQVVASREKEGSSDGLYFAAKGGNNAESHNHNDVGNFIVYYNGQPALIDAGVGTYTAKTFSGDRYSIWSMQSQYHNLPTINGFMQHEGSQFAAHNIRYSSDDQKVKFSLELHDCYPAEASVERWNRNYEFRRKGELILTDNFRLEKIKGITTWNFLTCLMPDISEAGVVVLRQNDGYRADKEIRIVYDSKALDVNSEEVITDPASQGYAWNATLYRLVFTPKKRALNGTVTFKVTPE